VIAIFVPPLVTKSADVARAIASAGRDAGAKPVIACFLGREGIPEELRADGDRRTIPSFAFPEAAARALGRVAALAEWRREPPGIEPELDGIDVDTARAFVRSCVDTAPEGRWLDVEESTQLMHHFGIPIVESRLVHGADEAASAAQALGFPVVLKAGSPELVHKSDVGGVVLGLADAVAVKAAYTDMERRLGADMGGAIVQATVAHGVETIVGVTQDPSFGPLVLFGLGGVTAELLADRALRIVPMTDEDARRLVRSLRGSPLLFGYRGRPTVDVAALEDLLLRVGRLADELPEVSEMDMNPVIVFETGAIAVDLKIRCVRAPEPLPPDFRRMRA
jgi:acyl-CoA synthetase (NDP forming)